MCVHARVSVHAYTCSPTYVVAKVCHRLGPLQANAEIVWCAKCSLGVSSCERKGKEAIFGSGDVKLQCRAEKAPTDPLQRALEWVPVVSIVLHQLEMARPGLWMLASLDHCIWLHRIWLS
jgi:hypothetical protein